MWSGAETDELSTSRGSPLPRHQHLCLPLCVESYSLEALGSACCLALLRALPLLSAMGLNGLPARLLTPRLCSDLYHIQVRAQGCMTRWHMVSWIRAI